MTAFERASGWSADVLQQWVDSPATVRRAHGTGAAVDPGRHQDRVETILAWPHGEEIAEFITWYALHLIPAAHASEGRAWGVTALPTSRTSRNDAFRINVGKVEVAIGHGRALGVTAVGLNVWSDRGEVATQRWLHEQTGLPRRIETGDYSTHSGHIYRMRVDNLRQARKVLSEPEVASAVRVLNAKLVTTGFPHRAGHSPAILEAGGFHAPISRSVEEVPRSEGDRSQTRTTTASDGASHHIAQQESEIAHAFDAARYAAAVARHRGILQDLKNEIVKRDPAGEVRLEAAFQGVRIDALWRIGSSAARAAIIEAKSLDDDNAAWQIRLAIGQVLDYRRRLAQHGSETDAAILLADRPPTGTEHWRRLCSDLGISLVLPDGIRSYVAAVLGVSV